MISVALLGTGTMGIGMGANLLKAGFPLTVYNRTRLKADPLITTGAGWAGTPGEAASNADVILSILADDTASREAWIGANGALASAKVGAVLVECSTLSPAWIAELANMAQPRGLVLLDAPVTGSRVQAETGQLTFLVGGSEEALEKVRPVLQVMSKQIVYLGPTGSGATMKLVNNFLCGVQVASLAEAIAWLERSGLNCEKALEILKNGAPGSPLLSAISSRMMQREYSVNFLLKLMSKDLLYAHQEAASSGVDLTTATAARNLFEGATAAGYADKDMASIVELFRNGAGG